MRLHKRQLVFDGSKEILHFENNRLIFSDIIMKDKFSLFEKCYWILFINRPNHQPTQ